MRRLLLMRHGKSDWNAGYDGDHQRPLNQRGVRSARLMGRFLSDQGLAPDHVVTSTALRARSTAHLAAEAGGWEAGIRLERALYDASTAGILSQVVTAPDVPTLMLVGHQPTFGMVISSLTGVRVDVKTASVAVIDLPVRTWADAGGARGELESIHHPRSYFGSRWDPER